MSDTHEDRVKQSTEARRRVREASHECPLCGQPGLQPLGGMRSCWFECSCGAYSPLSATWEEALSNTDAWQIIGADSNACMHPKVGESH